MTKLIDMSPEKLAKARTRNVEELQELNDKIIIAKLRRHKSERRKLQRHIDYTYRALKNIDAELKRRAPETSNA